MISTVLGTCSNHSLNNLFQLNGSVFLLFAKKSANEILKSGLSSVLKLYFRDLPTPLVTYDLYPHLVLASKQSEPRRGEKFREILQRLPGGHYR